jgi:transaldolase
MRNPRTLALHDVGQRLWLDNITRQLLQSGTLAPYVRELSVTGLYFESDDIRTCHRYRYADGWVSLEVSPLLAHDATGTIRAAARLHSQPCDSAGAACRSTRPEHKSAPEKASD